MEQKEFSLRAELARMQCRGREELAVRRVANDRDNRNRAENQKGAQKLMRAFGMEERNV